jgi:hypothetical protein
MAVRNEYRILVESEKDDENPWYLKVDERGPESDRTVHLTIAGSGINPYEDDPGVMMTLAEATELRDCLDKLIAG